MIEKSEEKLQNDSFIETRKKKVIKLHKNEWDDLRHWFIVKIDIYDKQFMFVPI